ncbi:MAG: hypothetical protein RI927_598, partial [Actinomycetota bacterium]
MSTITMSAVVTAVDKLLLLWKPLRARVIYRTQGFLRLLVN